MAGDIREPGLCWSSSSSLNALMSWNLCSGSIRSCGVRSQGHRSPRLGNRAVTKPKQWADSA